MPSDALSSLELAVSPEQLEDGRLMGWPVSQTRFRWTSSGTAGHVCDRVLGYPAFLAVIWLRLAATLWLPFMLDNLLVTAMLCGVLFVTLVAQALRSPYGLDGADQMMMLIFGSAALGGLAGTPLALTAAVWFIALQSVLSYLTAGSRDNTLGRQL